MWGAAWDASAVQDGKSVVDTVKVALDEAVRGSDATGERVAFADTDVFDDEEAIPDAAALTVCALDCEFTLDRTFGTVARGDADPLSVTMGVADTDLLIEAPRTGDAVASAVAALE